MRISSRYVRNGVPLSYEGVRLLVWAFIRIIEGPHRPEQEATHRGKQIQAALQRLGEQIDSVENGNVEDRWNVRALLSVSHTEINSVIKILRRSMRYQPTAKMAKQLEAAVEVRKLVKQSHTFDLLMHEVNKGKVQCPECSHVFTAEDHTID